MARMLGKCGHGTWPWWCCDRAVVKTRRIARKIEKRMWPKAEEKAND